MTDAKPKHDMDEHVKIPLDPELAIRALLKVDPDAEPAADAGADEPKREQPAQG